MGAPTEAEIRAAVRRRLDQARYGGQIRDAIIDTAMPVSWPAEFVLDQAWCGWEMSDRSTWDGDEVFEPLSREQAERLSALVGAAKDTAEEQCKAIVERQLMDAAAQFLREYPDAPRYVPQVTA